MTLASPLTIFNRAFWLGLLGNAFVATADHTWRGFDPFYDARTPLGVWFQGLDLFPWMVACACLIVLIWRAVTQ